MDGYGENDQTASAACNSENVPTSQSGNITIVNEAASMNSDAEK